MNSIAATWDLHSVLHFLAGRTATVRGSSTTRDTNTDSAEDRKEIYSPCNECCLRCGNVPASVPEIQKQHHSVCTVYVSCVEELRDRTSCSGDILPSLFSQFHFYVAYIGKQNSIASQASLPAIALSVECYDGIT